jgi:hypothetical protein
MLRNVDTKVAKDLRVMLQSYVERQYGVEEDVIDFINILENRLEASLLTADDLLDVARFYFKARDEYDNI